MATVSQVLEDADRILATWEGNSDFSLATMTKVQMTAKRDEVRSKAALIEQKRVELRGLTESLTDEIKELGQMNTRAKSGFPVCHNDLRHFPFPPYLPRAKRKEPE